ncbi:copper-translocating P-type ATPase [Thermaerobacter marianensis DSM 12885]|uniref:Copper-translocating P-type ATPase n=1 Tax=Thermaerobacter marianensis (strain ATCC 700841 / DSM 12885 / JCM 10246 / 7p75a) TaxID=644966 RepID=E6SGT5_THEM7|nr:cupredoxin domain-containing protein [Thermaerobacter marianensis]ADU51669.1 copper-translocating P-type ATPase [Thermaerobacter marianensis DSM 12885]
MSATDIVVILVGAVIVVGIAWFFWGPRRAGTRASLTSTGYQEAMVLVKGGYTPDVIVVQRGKPVRIHFRREETAACSEMVVFADFGKSARLPAGETVTVELLPEEPGEYDFTCQMGMLRGKLVVE